MHLSTHKALVQALSGIVRGRQLRDLNDELIEDEVARHHMQPISITGICGGQVARVSEAAAACGIPHAGRFSHYYRLMYGESPRKTLAQA